MSNETIVSVQLQDGRRSPVHVCVCGRCGNEWYTPGLSDEWEPSFCPYCGLQFSYRTVDGEDKPYAHKREFSDTVDEIVSRRVLEEREECAKVCEDEGNRLDRLVVDTLRLRIAAEKSLDLAAAIRARGQGHE